MALAETKAKDKAAITTVIIHINALNLLCLNTTFSILFLYSANKGFSR